MNNDIIKICGTLNHQILLLVKENKYTDTQYTGNRLNPTRVDPGRVSNT